MATVFNISVVPQSTKKLYWAFHFASPLQLDWPLWFNIVVFLIIDFWMRILNCFDSDFTSTKYMTVLGKRQVQRLTKIA